MTDKRLGVKDANGYAIEHVPDKVGDPEQPAISLKAACKIAFPALYNGSAAFREDINSLDNKNSVSGNLQIDRAHATEALLGYIKDHELPGLDGVAKPLGKIRGILPDLLKLYKLDPQSRIRKAITDGRTAAADRGLTAPAE